MIMVIHKQDGYSATADEVRRNQIGIIVAVHIPLIGWKIASEFEIMEDNKC